MFTASDVGAATQARYTSEPAPSTLASMIACPGCGGRNPPELEVCPFCEYRVGTRTQRSRWFRPSVVSVLLLALVLGAMVVLIIRPGLF